MITAGHLLVKRVLMLFSYPTSIVVTYRMLSWFTRSKNLADKSSNGRITFDLCLTISPENEDKWGASQRTLTVTPISQNDDSSLNLKTVTRLLRTERDFRTLCTIRLTAAKRSVSEGRTIDWQRDAELTLEAGTVILSRTLQQSGLSNSEIKPRLVFSSSPITARAIEGSPAENTEAFFTKIKQLTRGYTEWERALEYCNLDIPLSGGRSHRSHESMRSFKPLQALLPLQGEKAMQERTIMLCKDTSGLRSERPRNKIQLSQRFCPGRPDRNVHA